jgi:hypothetical protein
MSSAKSKLILGAMGLGAVMAAGAPGAPAAGDPTAPQVWQCRGSAVWASVTGFNRVEPMVANGNPNTANGASPDRAQCATAETGLENLGSPLGLPADLLTARTASATATLTPALGASLSQKVATTGKIEDLALQLPPGGSGLVLGVGVARSKASASCQGGKPVLSGTSELTNLTINGNAVTLDDALKQLADGLAPLHQLAILKVDEQDKTATSLTQRALHLSIINQDNQASVLEVVAGEAKVGFTGAVCSAASSSSTSTTTSPGSGVAGLTIVKRAGPNGTNGGCGHIAMWFDRNRKHTLATRFGTRAVTRGRLVNCKGKPIVGARIDVVHVINGHRHLVKTGLKSRGGGKLTLILPLNLTTRTIEYAYRGTLSSRRISSLVRLHLTVRDRRGRIVRTLPHHPRA